MLEESLAAVVGAARVVTDPELRVAAEVDWTGRWRGVALAVVRPGSGAEVAAVLAVCAAAGVPVVPQGGNTGLVGGSGPGPQGAVVLSTRRLTELAPVAADGTVVVGAGATLAAVQAHAARAGWQLGLDWAARDTATIGGAIATNAGGLRVLRWGPARAQLVGAEVALADGSLLSRVDGPLKDSTGYDLSGLMCGSEGTLGVLTRVRLRLVPPLPTRRAVALVGVASITAALDLLAAARRSGLDLAAAELIGSDALDLLSLPPPLPGRWPAYVLLETVGRTGGPPGTPTGATTGAAALLDELATMLAGAEVGDAVLATDPRTGPGSGATGRTCRPRSPPPVSRSSSTSRSRTTGWPRSGRRWPTPLAPSSSDTWPRRTCTSTCWAPPTRRPPRTTYCGWWPASVARSAPSTASAGPRPAGCTSPARPPSWPPCARSRPLWTPPTSSTRGVLLT